MLEYTSIGNPPRRVSIIPEYVESLTQNGVNAKQTVLTMASGATWIVDAPYEEVRIHIGQALGSDLRDEEFEDGDFLNSVEGIG